MATLVEDGPLIRYQTRDYGSSNPGTTIRLVWANCATRERSEIVMGTHYDNPNPPLYSVLRNDRYIRELETACVRLKTPNVASLPSTPPAASQATPLVPTREEPPIRSSGSGFIIASGYVVTNEHVTEDCRELYLRQGPKRFRGKLVTASKRTDLALVGVPDLRQVHVPALRSNALLGEDVIVAGHPLSGLLSSDLIVTSGQVNATTGIADDPTIIQISAPVQPGNSGGPLIDRSGNIVGVVVSKLNVAKMEKITGDMSQNVNFAIKPEILRLFLDSTRISYRSGTLGKPISNVDIARNARKFTVKVECN